MHIDLNQESPAQARLKTAAGLAWIGDPAAEHHAREGIRRLDGGEDPRTWPRRVASATIDLALTPLIDNRLGEACDHTLRAIASGRAVPSNRRRAAEVVHAVEARGPAEAPGLREAFEQMPR